MTSTIGMGFRAVPKRLTNLTSKFRSSSFVFTSLTDISRGMSLIITFSWQSSGSLKIMNSNLLSSRMFCILRK